MNKKDTIAHWKRMISTRPDWALRAAIRIHQLQTPEEQNSHATLESNGVGFNSFDSPVITGIVNRHLRGRVITPREQSCLTRRMPKYATQLYNHTQGK